ncbi:hypothetical protein M0R45_014355 [Rubus argutus]|uniref:Uncharacterized protein n=1 Tax=Rubus argutus TaxID=59490 RepID=A0AAW1XL46_RUBAR
MARPTPIYIRRRQIRVQSFHTQPFAFGEVGRRFGEVAAAFLIQDESQVEEEAYEEVEEEAPKDETEIKVGTFGSHSASSFCHGNWSFVDWSL